MEVKRLKQYLLLALFVGFQSSNAKAQNILVKYLKYTLMDTSDEGKAKVIFYPTLSYAPETKWELGLSGLLVYRAKQDTNNRLSELKSFSFLTLENQYGSVLEHALYTDKNKFFFLGETRIQNFPINYYGIGPSSRKEDELVVHTNELRMRERVLRQIKPSIFTGFEIDFQRLANVTFEESNTLETPIGYQGSANLSLGWGLLYDNIHNVLNPREGRYLEIAYLGSQRSWGSNFNFHNIFTDARFYHSLNTRNVIAGQVYGQFGTGDIPFNEMAQMGGEKMMRGYYLGRYRDKNITSAQLAFRMLPFPFAKRWGGAAFASTSTVFPAFNAYTLNNLKWAVGFGPRFLLFPKKDVYTRLDFAFTQEGKGVYLHVGEAF